MTQAEETQDKETTQGKTTQTEEAQDKETM
jgi:hypothetical protein